jgi:hypothetical protein
MSGRYWDGCRAAPVRLIGWTCDFATCIQSDVRVGLSWVEDDRSDPAARIRSPKSGRKFKPWSLKENN